MTTLFVAARDTLLQLRRPLRHRRAIRHQNSSGVADGLSLFAVIVGCVIMLIPSSLDLRRRRGRVGFLTSSPPPRPASPADVERGPPLVYHPLCNLPRRDGALQLRTHRSRPAWSACSASRDVLRQQTRFTPSRGLGALGLTWPALVQRSEAASSPPRPPGGGGERCGRRRRRPSRGGPGRPGACAGRRRQEHLWSHCIWLAFWTHWAWASCSAWWGRPLLGAAGGPSTPKELWASSRGSST